MYHSLMGSCVSWQRRFSKTSLAVQKNVFVREPLILTPNIPAICQHHELTIPVSVYNGPGSEASFEVSLNATRPVAVGNATQSITVEAGRAVVYFKVKAGDGIGAIKFDLAAKGNSASAER